MDGAAPASYGHKAAAKTGKEADGSGKTGRQTEVYGLCKEGGNGYWDGFPGHIPVAGSNCSSGAAQQAGTGWFTRQETRYSQAEIVRQKPGLRG